MSIACTQKIEKDYLNNILNNLKKETKSIFGGKTIKFPKIKMIYRGSEHGFMYKDFHSRCDGKGPTISLFKLKHNGDCIGGYTEA